MHHGTPFFQGFSSILFGRPALSGLQKTLREIAALNTLSDFFETFGFLIPDALLRRRSHGTNSRQRRFTLHVTFWAFLAQTLAPDTSCRDIVRKVQAWWLLRAPKSVVGSASTAAYTKARKRLDPAAVRGISRHLVDRLEGRVQSSQLWLGRRVRVVDGTTVSMPDTPENQIKYPQPSSQKAGCGFPQMRVVGLFSLASGALLDFAHSSIRVHESILFGQLISGMVKGDIALADRGFCSFHQRGQYQYGTICSIPVSIEVLSCCVCPKIIKFRPPRTAAERRNAYFPPLRMRSAAAARYWRRSLVSMEPNLMRRPLWSSATMWTLLRASPSLSR